MTTPKGLEADGKRLWRAVAEGFELETHELLLLEHACRTADTIAGLTSSAGGDLVDGKGRVRAEIVEARQQRIVLARLLAALRVPLGDEGSDTAKHGPKRLQRRSTRGVYAIGGKSA